MQHVYLAGPIFSPAHLSVINRITSVARMGHWDYFSPYEESRGIWNGRAPKDCTPEERRLVVEGNIKGLHWADVLVAWTNGSDTGTVWEMGYFKALSDAANEVMDSVGAKHVRFTIAYIDPRDLKQNLNLMLAETVDAAVYGTAQLDEALRLLRTNEPEMDKVRSQYHPSKLILHEKDPIPHSD